MMLADFDFEMFLQAANLVADGFSAPNCGRWAQCACDLRSGELGWNKLAPARKFQRVQTIGSIWRAGRGHSECFGHCDAAEAGASGFAIAVLAPPHRNQVRGWPSQSN
jgi:hypothetical protein